jgi:hypothetical protein
MKNKIRGAQKVREQIRGKWITYSESIIKENIQQGAYYNLALYNCHKPIKRSVCP